MIDGKPVQLGAMLISLDGVLDTVQGTLAAVNPTLYAKNAVSGYFTRLRDEFEGISKEDFQKAYAKRGAMELMLSTVTPAVSLITDFVKKVNTLSLHGPIALVPRVDINFFPFTPPEHVVDHILTGIRAHVKERFNLNAICVDPKEITFDYVRVNYDHVVMYDLGPWLEAQVQDGKLERGIPNVTLIGPIINRSDEELTMEELHNRAMVAGEDFAPLFNLVLMPLEVFCTAMNPAHIKPPPPRAEAPDDGVEVDESKLDKEDIPIEGQPSQDFSQDGDDVFGLNF